MDVLVSPAGQVVLIGVVLWTINMFVLTVYLHRYLAHRAFTLTVAGRALCRTLFCLSFIFRRNEWVGIHRAHHRSVGTPRDPHPSEELGAVRALVLAHWLYHRAATAPEVWRSAVGDLPEDWLDRVHGRLPVAGPAMLLVAGVWAFGWRVFIPAFALNQVLAMLTFSALVSLTHTVGRRPRPVAGRDSHLVSALLWGEGYHNNHHFRPRSPNIARGIRGVDFGYILILAMAGVGLAQLPSRRSAAPGRDARALAGRTGTEPGVAPARS